MTADLAVSSPMIDAIVAAVTLEFVGLSVWLGRSPGSSRFVLPLLFYLGSGVALLLALRASLVGAAPHWIALALVASLISHLASLHRLYRVLPLPGRPAERSLRAIEGATRAPARRID